MNKNHIIPTLEEDSTNPRKEPISQMGVEQYLLNLAKIRQEKGISIDEIMEHLNFSRGTLEQLEKGNLDYIIYPINFFFLKQYAEYLKVPFPKQYLMNHFKPKEKK